MLSSSSSLFDTLPTRPPTPPRDVNEHVRHAFDFLINGHEDTTPGAEAALKPPPSTDTPPVSSPIASQEAPATANAGRKVNFSPWTTYHEIPQVGFSSSPGQRLLRGKPSPRDLKPTKSILKLSATAPPLTPDEFESRLSYFSPNDPSSFARMLQSVLQELSSASRTSRLDAYLTLNGTLKTYEGFPDRQAITSKIGQLQQFLSRDMVSKDPSGAIDSQIATQALKLIGAMLYDAQLSKIFDDDFRTLVVDRGIVAMESSDLPKSMVKTYLYLLAQQHFPQHVMTSGRAERIITTVRNIEERCSGNNLLASRLVIYLRLLEQAPSVMLARMKDWLEHVFHGMLSSIKDTRIRAIEVCTHAGIVLGTNPTASKFLHELFETEVEEGQTYCDYLTLRLEEMVKEQDMGAYVPQIWSAVVLFFRSKKRPLDRWSRFRSWLVLLQRCLNANDLTVKYQATLAWKKLVFAIMPDANTTPAMFSMLKVPITAGFEKRASDRTAKQQRQWAMDGYYNLLHYAMRPALSYQELDAAWDMHVDTILGDMIKASTKGRYNASKVLHGLLSPNAGSWNENAALEADAIKPDELPRLDPRWIRSRFTRVVKLVEPILSAGFLLPSEQQVYTTVLWQDVLQSVADAGMQEVRTHTELREAIALVMNMFQRLWAFCTPSGAASAKLPAAIEGFQRLLRTTCQYLGPSHLVEDMLSRTPQGEVQAAPTPSHRPSKHPRALHSPLVSVLSTVCSNAGITQNYQQHASLVAEVLTLACEAKTTAAAKIQLLARTSQELQNASAASAAFDERYWSIFAVQATDALSSTTTEPSEKLIGQTLRDVVGLVSQCVSFSGESGQNIAAACGLTQMAVQTAKNRAGDAGLVMVVAEPVAKILLVTGATSLRTRLTLSTIILQSTPWPANRLAMDQARKVLWGISSGQQRAGSFDPFEHVYAMIRNVLEDCLTSTGTDGLDLKEVTGFLQALQLFLHQCPVSLAAETLRHLQESLALLLEDGNRIVFDRGYPALGDLVLQIWTQTIMQIEKMPSHDSVLLNMLQGLVTAGFASPRRAIVNKTILFWNDTFGLQPTLLYPPQLEKVLRAVRAQVELNLPGIPDNGLEVDDFVLPAFTESQDEIKPSASSRLSGLLQGTSSPKKSTADPQNGSSYLNTIATTSSRSTSRSASKPTPIARLRHNNSQIEFAPIESSPLQHVEESQLLTDHQLEVKARQTEGTQMFPELSSSPVRKPDALPMPIPKKLDFTPWSTSIPQDNEVAGTPVEELPEAQADMSDYLGSSPTPRSSDKAAIDLQQELLLEELDEQDPPSSSPPRPSAQDVDAQHKDRDAADEEEEEDPRPDVAASTADSLDSEESRLKPGRVLQNSDLASDTVLPTEQLRHEAEAANAQQEKADEQHIDSITVAGLTVTPDDPAEDDEDEVQQSTQQSKVAQDELDYADVSRIENSFAAQDAITEIDTPELASQSQARSRKRKRGCGFATATASKKRKAQSPFKRFFSGMFGAQQEEDDDIEEEIIVASSQPTQFPAVARNAQLGEEESQEASELQSASQSLPVKRKPGRPRKSETPTPAPPAASKTSTRNLKRKASNLSQTSAAEVVPATSAVETTPAMSSTLTRSQRRRLAKAVKSAQPSSQIASQTDDDNATEPRTNQRGSRVARAVVVERSGTPDSVVPVRMADSDDENILVTPSKLRSEKEEAAAIADDRPKLTPKSIIGRLRDILGDFKNIFLSEHEHREADDVLFEIRNEVHAAARRGKGQ